MRGLDGLRSETTQVAIALVVGEDNDEIRGGGLRKAGREGARGQDREEKQQIQGTVRHGLGDGLFCRIQGCRRRTPGDAGARPDFIRISAERKTRLAGAFRGRPGEQERPAGAARPLCSGWCGVTDSNRRPTRCKRVALPTELTPHHGIRRREDARSIDQCKTFRRFFGGRRVPDPSSARPRIHCRRFGRSQLPAPASARGDFRRVPGASREPPLRP